MNDLGIYRLIYVLCETLSQTILSFTRVVLVLVAEVTGGTSRDLKALPGHLWALPRHLGFAWASGGFAKTSVSLAWASASFCGFGRTDPGF